MKNTIVALLLALGVSLPASAAIVLQEQFDYGSLTQGASINGQTGGTGWSAGWGAGSSAYQTAGLSYSSSTVALTYSATGGAVATQSNANVIRAFATSAPPTAGSTYWGAFLFNFNGVAPVNGATRAVFWSAGSNNGMSVEFTNDGAGGGRVAARAASGTAGSVVTSTTTFDFSTSATNLIIFRSVWSDTAGGDSMTLWLNPTDVSSVAALGAGSSVSGDFGSAATPNIYLRANNSTSPWIFDEFALGTALSDVAAVVPEPTAAILSALPLAGCLLRRRR